jgi:hypothetical protein
MSALINFHFNGITKLRASMKKFFCFAGLIPFFMSILWISCEKKNPVTVVTSPKIAVTQNSYSLRGGDANILLILLNIGNGNLEWNLGRKPAWISVSRTSGNVQSAPDSVYLSTETDGLEFGEYQGVLQINSNGGNTAVTVALNHNRPRIKVWLPILSFTRQLLDNSLLVYNHGGNILDWNVASMPAWIEVSRSNGRVTEAPDTLSVRARMEGLDFRNYTDKIRFESNGGSDEVIVDLFFEREIEIFPGVGAARIEIGNTYGETINVQGFPLKAVFEQHSKDELHYYLLYPNKGLTVEILTDHMLIDTDLCDRITVESPYSGITDRQIGVGSLLSQLVSAYGPPKSISTADSTYNYDGITFQYGPDSSFVEKIHIPQ